MFVEQFVDKGLGNAAYLVGSHETKRAALIDPLRDVDRYVSAADRLGVKITDVLETHLHADFISGARELAVRGGIRIGASAEAGLAFEHQPLTEGHRIELGELTLGVLATPGHTPEHISFTLTKANGHGEGQAPSALFSGGALIVGGAARTDLLGHHLTEPLARHLYHTIHRKLLALPDAVNVYPTHGAGSFCAAPSVSDRTTTIGLERSRNPLAQAQTEEEFVALALRGLSSYPHYFQEMRAINQRGPRVLGGLPILTPLPPESVHDWMRRGGVAVDVRPARAFAEGYIPGSYGIALESPLITWAGWLIPFGMPLVLVTETAADREEAIRQLIRIGYDDLRGYLEGGLAAWQAGGLPVGRVRTISVAELRERLAAGDPPVVLDVRQDGEYAAGHIPGALHIENGRLPFDPLPLPADHSIVIHCQHRNRSTAGLSVLAQRGYRDLVLVDGGFAAWQEAGFQVERGLDHAA